VVARVYNTQVWIPASGAVGHGDESAMSLVMHARRSQSSRTATLIIKTILASHHRCRSKLNLKQLQTAAYALFFSPHPLRFPESRLSDPPDRHTHFRRRSNCLEQLPVFVHLRHSPASDKLGRRPHI
jgi:hypothetical protein